MGVPLYVDTWTEEAFNETGGDTYIDREQLAAVGQIHRSTAATDTFKQITQFDIGSKAGLKNLFKAANAGKINLPEILTTASLDQYISRKTMFSID